MKALWRSNVGVFLFLSLSCSCASQVTQRPAALTLPQAIDQLRASTVQIRVTALGISPEIAKKFNWNRASRPIGSGFIVNSEGYVITANHVINGGQQMLSQIGKAEFKGMEVGVPFQESENSSGNFQGFSYQIIGQDIQNDLAILKLQPNPFEMKKTGITGVPLNIAPVVLDTKAPKDGTAIAISGYPFGQPILFTNSGAIAAAQAKMPVDGKDYDYLHVADLVAHPGNSGGPAYEIESGRVIGVCFARGSGFALLIPAHHVVELLRKYSVRWQ